MERYPKVIFCVILLGVVGQGAAEEPAEVSRETNQTPNDIQSANPPTEAPVSPPYVTGPVAPDKSGAPLSAAPERTPWKPGDPVRIRRDLRTSTPPEGVPK